MIGIKTADGKLFPILQEDEKTKKRVILTTVRDDQPLVHIDLYRGKGEQMEAAELVGRLRIEHVPPSKQGEPDIELLLGMDTEGNLISKAKVDSPNTQTEEQSLIVRLNEPHEPSGEFSVNDFTIKESEATEDINANGSKELYFNSYATEEKERQRRRNYLLILAGVFAVIAILILGYVLFFRNATPTPPKSTAETPAPTTIPPTLPTSKPEGKTEAPQVQKPDSVGVWYSTVKGDNLWNLARSFYRNPWLYKKIAEENGIPNPDFILQDVRLYIPDVETGKR
ncbi:MAG: Hsp70 family protein [Spirochaetes bacterium]|nr:Hsp70 family protein [Spirochaetota bacterium]